MTDGFERMLAYARFNSHSSREQLVGSFFSIEDQNHAKADFLTEKQHPELFVNGIDFNKVHTYYKQR